MLNFYRGGGKRVARVLTPGAMFPVLALALAICSSCGKEDTADESRALKERLERLKSIPYTATTEDTVPECLKGVTLHDRARAWQGYNLYCSRIEPEAFLLDMGGNIVNRWFYEQDRFNFWNYAILDDDGDLVVLNDTRYILKLDWDSNLVWEQPRPVNHDVAGAPDGTLYAIEYDTRQHRGLTVRFGQIVHLDADGEALGIWSTHDRLDYLKEVLDTSSFLDVILDSMIAHGVSPDTLQRISGKVDVSAVGRGARLYDYFRLNTVTIVPETPLGRRDPRFAAGRLLICLRNVNQICTLDWDSGKILWRWGAEELEWPHHPTMLENGNILVFDNGVVRKYSRVIELNPVSGEVEWEYIGNPPEEFYSRTRGSSQRLPNGNTLICESNDGRAFEVTRDGETVWEWFNPIMRDDRRAQVYRMIRYPAEMIEPLLAERGRDPSE